MNQCSPAIFLMGPTASGKTALAMALCQHFPVELISVDSALIYRGMDVGTAKPTLEEQTIAPHRLIDIRDPGDIYSVADFRVDALREMAAITAVGKIPLLVGGTMLYFKALLEGLSPLPPADSQTRKRIEQMALEQGWESVHQALQRVDPKSAFRIHPNDPQRLSRALEVFLVSGHTLTELIKISGERLPYQIYQFAMAPAIRKQLHQRIEQRFHHMLASGFETEVRTLFARSDLHPDLPAIRCVGYRQMWSYLAGEISYYEMVYRGVCASRQLAKRQLTWLRGWSSSLCWLNSDQPTQALECVAKVIRTSL